MHAKVIALIAGLISGSAFAASSASPGTLWVAGNNFKGGIGNGAAPTDAKKYNEIAAGVTLIGGNGRTSFFALSDGTLWGMGENEHGALGLGNITDAYRPVKIPGVSGGVVAIAVGGMHTLFAKSDGTLWVMGYNRQGQLGLGNKVDVWTPTQVPNVTGVVAVAAAENHSFFLCSDGNLWGMGEGDYGVRGNDPTPDEALVPELVTTNVASIATGKNHSLFTKTDGSLWVMGFNDRYQLGTYDAKLLLPKKIVDSGVVSVAAGVYHSLFLKSDGSVWSMGDNDRGQLGVGEKYKEDYAGQTRVLNPGGLPATAISAGGHFCAFIDTARKLWVFGENNNGQLATGDTTDSATPINVAQSVLACSANGGIVVGGSSVAGISMIIREQSRLYNLSIRAKAGGSGPLIVGFTPKNNNGTPMLVRAIGPTLGTAPFNVPGVMADPRLDVYSGSTMVASNDNWGTEGVATMQAAFASTGAFGLTNTASLDAAKIDQATGARTVHVNSVTGAAGVVIVEAYDRGDVMTPRLTNLSARNFCGTGADVMICGFTISGNAPMRLLVRAVGPGLSQWISSGLLADPKLEIHTTVNGADTTVATNDNWNTETDASTAMSTAGAFALPAGSKDAVLVRTLNPGSYTAIASGINSGTGEVLIELYELP